MRPAWASLALGLLAACEVGAPLVDREPKLPPTIYDSFVIACRMPSACREEPRSLGTTLNALRTLRELGCTEGGCEAPSLDLPQRADPSATVFLDDARWSERDIAIASDEPIEIVLTDSRVSGVRIDLAGPITLRFTGGTTVRGAQISSASRDSRVAFDHVMAQELTVGDAEHPFAGALEAKHTTFDQPSMNVESASFDSAVLVHGFFASSALTSRDGSFEDMVLALGSALFAPAQLHTVEITRCDELTFFGSRLTEARVPACTGEATRIYTSTLAKVELDGAIRADSSTMESVHFGQRAPTSLELWATDVRTSAFCDHVEDAAIEGDASCNACSDGFSERAPVCTLPNGAPASSGMEARYNFCEVLDTADVCSPPPDRPRPHAVEE